VPTVDFDPVTMPFHERMLVAHDATLGAGSAQPMAYDGVRPGAGTDRDLTEESDI